jgi:hypothetical protein
MHGRILIADTISSEAIAGWEASDSNEVVFEIRRTSAFEMFADVDAIVKLHELQSTSTQIALEFTFNLPANFLDHFLHEGFGAFSGLFGLSLVLSARRISVRGSAVSTGLADRVWEGVMRRNALIASYLKGHIVFRDPDYPIPSCLPRRDLGFPYPTGFKKVVRELSAAIPEFGGRSFGTDIAEERLLEFLYETARNAHEHARPRSSNRTLAQVRGISVEKRTIKGLRIPATLTTAFNEYLARTRSRFGAYDSLVVATVVDLGPGIQNTLPAQPGESAPQRLVRAITTRASSKPASTDTTRGLGLPNVISAAQRLHALLVFSSAGLVASIDATREAPSVVCHVGTARLGTAVSLVWPAVQQSTDQVELFPSR